MVLHGTLCHVCIFQFVVKATVRVLETSVAVNQGTGSRILHCCLVKRSIVMVVNGVGDNLSVTGCQESCLVRFCGRLAYCANGFRRIVSHFLEPLRMVFSDKQVSAMYWGLTRLV